MLPARSKHGRARKSTIGTNPVNRAKTADPRVLLAKLPTKSNGATFCISAAPAAFDRYPRGFTGHVARPSRSIRLNLRRAVRARAVSRNLDWRNAFTPITQHARHPDQFV